MQLNLSPPRKNLYHRTRKTHPQRKKPPLQIFFFLLFIMELQCDFSLSYQVSNHHRPADFKNWFPRDIFTISGTQSLLVFSPDHSRIRIHCSRMFGIIVFACIAVISASASGDWCAEDEHFKCLGSER